MNINEVLEKKMPKALEYASHIIYESKNFMDFAIALADYMGEDFIPYSKSVYAMLRSLPQVNNIKFESAEEIDQYSSDYIVQQFREYQIKQEQRKREQEFKENIDELQFLVKNYRSSEEFKKMLDFIGKFHYLAPYNAMLVQMQKPGATFVFNGKKWAEYGRRPSINAQKLIILKPFGPIQCVFDFSDTEPILGLSSVSIETKRMRLNFIPSAMNWAISSVGLQYTSSQKIPKGPFRK